MQIILAKCEQTDNSSVMEHEIFTSNTIYLNLTPYIKDEFQVE